VDVTGTDVQGGLGVTLRLTTWASAILWPLSSGQAAASYDTSLVSG